MSDLKASAKFTVIVIVSLCCRVDLVHLYEHHDALPLLHQAPYFLYRSVMCGARAPPLLHDHVVELTVCCQAYPS